MRRPEFKLEITETPPTVDQLRTILDYVGKARVGTIVKGAADQEEALRRFGEDVESLRRPVVCFLLLSFLFLSLPFSFLLFDYCLLLTACCFCVGWVWLTDWYRLWIGTMGRWPPERMSRRF